MKETYPWIIEVIYETRKFRKATKINQEIKRLEQEIEFLDDANMKRTHSIVKVFMPNKYTYKGYFSSERDIGCIGSCVYLDHKECVALADFKRNEIEELQKQYELLDSE